MLFKFGAYLYTGSATMLSESIHSLADMLNQVCITYKEWCTWLQVVDSYSIRGLGTTYKDSESNTVNGNLTPVSVPSNICHSCLRINHLFITVTNDRDHSIFLNTTFQKYSYHDLYT